MYRKWTPLDISLLRKHFPILTTAELSVKLNRSEDSIKKQAKRLGLNKRFYTAFGETKSLVKWADDKRCNLSLRELRKQVKITPLEQILTRS